MKIVIDLPDAFESIEVDVPEQLRDWYSREAAHNKLTVPELLASKTSGLTVEQLRAVREHGKDVPEYVMRWILRQPHEIIGGDIPSAPPEAAAAPPQYCDCTPKSFLHVPALGTLGIRPTVENGICSACGRPSAYERRAPVQSDRRWPRGAPGSVPGTIPWNVHLRAWEGYAADGHGDQSAERIAQRSGFSYREVQCALLGHYNECSPDHNDEHPPVPGWEPIE